MDSTASLMRSPTPGSPRVGAGAGLCSTLSWEQCLHPPGCDLRINHPIPRCPRAGRLDLTCGLLAAGRAVFLVLRGVSGPATTLREACDRQGGTVTQMVDYQRRLLRLRSPAGLVTSPVSGLCFKSPRKGDASNAAALVLKQDQGSVGGSVLSAGSQSPCDTD